LYTLATIAGHFVEQQKPDEVEKYASEALEGSRKILNDKHQVRTAALSCLSEVYSRRADLKRPETLTKLESVLSEAVELARFRYGPNHGYTAAGDVSLGILLILMGRYSEAEPNYREALEYWVKHMPDDPRHALTELHLGVCLLARKEFDEARSRLISAYNRLKPRNTSPIPADTTDLGWIVEQITQLRDESGKPLIDVSLMKLQGDLALQAIALDLQFPAKPLAPP
jgi:Flp pilus assembly protein TadD